MKLLYCPVCDDVFRLVDQDWRCCMCGRSGGQYCPDSLTAVIGGKGKVFGIPNPLFLEAYMAGPDVIEALRKKYNNMWKTEVWWGEMPGDWQIIRVHNPIGPVPADWYKRVKKLKDSGGVKGYNTATENAARKHMRQKALLRKTMTDLCGRLWNKFEHIWEEVKDAVSSVGAGEDKAEKVQEQDKG